MLSCLLIRSHAHALLPLNYPQIVILNEVMDLVLLSLHHSPSITFQK